MLVHGDVGFKKVVSSIVAAIPVLLPFISTRTTLPLHIALTFLAGMVPNGKPILNSILVSFSGQSLT